MSGHFLFSIHDFTNYSVAQLVQRKFCIRLFLNTLKNTAIVLEWLNFELGNLDGKFECMKKEETRIAEHLKVLPLPVTL